MFCVFCLVFDLSGVAAVRATSRSLDSSDYERCCGSL